VSLRTKLVLYIVALHGVFAALTLALLRHNAWALVGMEAGFLLSLGLGIRWVRQLFVPLNLVATGAEIIGEADFTSKFVEVGQPEMDQLVRVYNRMIDQLREERLRLQEQHYFLHRVLEASPAGIITFDLDGCVDRVNPSAARMLGVEAAALTGTPLSAAASDFGRGVGALEVGASRVLPLGDGRQVKVQMAQFMDRGFPRSFAMMQELTEELRLSERAAYEKVIRLLSHEVNNSVAAIRSLLESALDYVPQLESDDREDFHTALTVSVERARHLDAFMGRFADVIRLPDPVKRPADLVALLQHVERLMQVECQRRRIRWSWEMPEILGAIEMDPDQLEQVLVNIVKNAMEAIGEDGLIAVALSTGQHRPVLIIEDTGAGILPEARRQLFTPFYSSKPNGQGIGLTLTAEILARHGFRFSLDSSPGRPTRFTIWF
jgi:two-component system, NtrC family, nitrogen regulation sensor histidine kinase NtrY